MAFRTLPALAALALLAAAVTAHAQGATAFPAPAPLAPAPEAEIVPTASDRHLRMTVPVLIEGQGPFDFMVDTGSEATVVTTRVRDQLGLTPAGNAVVVGMASRVTVELVNLDGLEFAARVFDGLEVPLLDARNVGADGILGLDTLQDLRVLIDFKADTIAVNDAAALGGNRGYEIVIRARRKLGRLIITEATLDNVRTTVIIDTGAQASIGNLALQKKLRARKRELITNKDVNGFEIVGTQDIARALKLGGMEINNLPIMFADGPAFEQLGLADKPAMILGMRDLRIFDRVAIDFATRTILFDAPSDSGFKSKMRFGTNPSRL
jgi:predicted aspartyl protease